MVDIKEILKKKIGQILKELGAGETNYSIDYSSNLSHGDISTNAALVSYQTLKKRFGSPKAEAWEIVIYLEKDKDIKKFVSKVVVEGPGFINFWLSKEVLISFLPQLLKELPRFLESDSYKRKKIMVEFCDPNPFKEFHIGHLRNIFLGESLARLLEVLGAKVWRVNYQGDVGLHVAKALWALNSKLKTQNSKLEEIEKKLLREKVRLLGECYVEGARAYEKDTEAKKEIQEINQKIYQKESNIVKTWQLGRKWSLEHFEEIYKRVGTKYNHYYFESEVAEPGRQIVLSHIDDRIFERDQGAVVFRGDHTRVFVTREDYATYEAKDLALAQMKYKDFIYDQSIIITANEQTEYFKVVLAALRKVTLELAEKTVHYPFGFVSLRDGKMASRLGNVITAEWLLDEAKARIKKAYPEMNSDTAERVAVAAVKYSMLRFSRESDIQFSFEESISLEGNSGPYLLYTFVRTQSVLRKAQNASRSKLKTNCKFEIEELLLLRLLYRFSDIVKKSAMEFAPNFLCDYLFNLSQAFNLFYQKHPIIEGGEKRDFRLALTAGVGEVLKNGLNLLGVEIVERM